MDTAYLKENVGDVLSLGMAAVVRANPADPVEYLSRWLVKHVQTQEREAKDAARLAAEKQEDVVLAQTEEKQKQAEVKQHTDDKKLVDDREAKFNAFMEEIKGPDGMFDGFVDHLRTCTNAAGVYVGRLESPEVMKYIAATAADKFLLEQKLLKGQGVTFDIFEDPEEEPEPEVYDDDGNLVKQEKKEPEPRTIFVPDVLMGALSDRVHFYRLPRTGCYYALRLSYDSTLNDESLDQAVEKETRRSARAQRNAERLRRRDALEAKRRARAARLANPPPGAPKLTKKQREAQAKQEQEEDDEEAAAADQQMEEDSEDSDEEAERLEKERKQKEEEDQEAEGDEEKKEEKKEEKVETEKEKEERLQKEAEAKKLKDEERLFAKVRKNTVHLAICLDTLGQNRRFNDKELALVVAYGKRLLAILKAQDKVLFQEERARRMGLIGFNVGFKGKSEGERESTIEELAQRLAKESKPHSAADLAFKYRQDQLLSPSMRLVISEFKTYNVFRGPLSVLQCLFYMLDYSKEDVADPDNTPNWKKMRPRFGEEIFNKIGAYDPRAEQKRGPKDKYARIEALRELLAGHDYESLKVKNMPLAEVFAFVNDALAVKRQAAKERRQKAAAERAAKAKAEQEAAEKAAADEEARLQAEQEKAEAEEEAAAAARAREEEEGDEEDE